MDLVESGDVEAIRSETPRSAGGGSDTCVCVCVVFLLLLPVPLSPFRSFPSVPGCSSSKRPPRGGVYSIHCGGPTKTLRLALPPHAGDESRRSVRDANIMVSRCVLLLFLVVARGGTFVLENPKGSLLEIGGGRGARPCRGIHRGAKWLRNYHRSRGPLGTFLGPSWNLIWALLGPFLGPSWIPWSPKRGPGQGARARDPRCNRGQGRMGGPYSLRAPAGTSPQVPALHREGPSVQAFHAHEVFQWRLREGALAVQQSARHRPARQVRPQGSHAQAARRRADSRWPERQAPSPCLGRPLIVGARGA